MTKAKWTRHFGRIARRGEEEKNKALFFSSRLLSHFALKKTFWNWHRSFTLRSKPNLEGFEWSHQSKAILLSPHQFALTDWFLTRGFFILFFLNMFLRRRHFPFLLNAINSTCPRMALVCLSWLAQVCDERQKKNTTISQIWIFVPSHFSSRYAIRLTEYILARGEDSPYERGGDARRLA